jgi:HD-like signal output (HDOD) protein/DNA-binding CsgD family transcriptional regulator
VPAPASSPEAPTGPRRQAPRSVAYGGGLAEALTLLEEPPIHPESRARLVRAIDAKHVSLGDATRTVETDIGLALAVLRAANRLPGRPRNGIVSVPDAIDALGAPAVLELARALPVLHPLGPSDRLGAALIRLAPHAVATRVAADLLGRHIGYAARDEPRLIAVIHDIGKVVLAAASADYLGTLTDASATPEDRLLRERRKLGIDHAALGALAVQRLGLPKAMSTAVEQHHLPDAPGPAGIVRLSDMLAHEAHGEAVNPAVLAAAGRGFGLDPASLQRMAYDVARSSEPRDVGIEPSPLTPMQHKVLRGLGRSLTYKQIAAELSVSDSTVRSHVHRVYEKLEVADRAQAVLLATERGWI